MPTAYATLADVRSSTGAETGEPQAAVERLIDVASRRIDYLCDRTFSPPTTATRLFRCSWSSDRTSAVRVDDLQREPAPTVEVAASEFASDWVAVPADEVRLVSDADRPVTRLRLLGRHRWARVTGSFGWAEVPAEITRATVLLVARLLKRQAAPMGTAASGGELGEVPFAGYDPDFRALISSFRRRSIG